MVYHQRWEQELAFDELKTHLSGRAVPVRSKTPAGVVQEIYGLVLAYYLIRRVIHDAAVVASAGVARGATGGLVSGPVAGGAAAATASPAGAVVPAGDQAEAVQLAEEAG